MKHVKITASIIISSILMIIIFIAGLLLGGRAGYFLCFSSLISGDAAKSHEVKLHTRNFTDISYGEDRRNVLDIYMPERGRRPFPVLLFFHGGRWTANSKDSFSYISVPYLDKGILFVSAGYRLAPEHPYPAALLDCRKAVEWIYRNSAAYGGDPKRIFVSGHSAGAHLASLVTADNSWIGKSGLPHDVIKGCIVVSGPTDLNLIRYREVRHFVTDKSLLPEASPLNHVKRGLPPFLIVYGTGDIMVPSRIPREFIARLKRFDVPVNEVALMLRTHSQTMDALSDPFSEVVPRVLALINGKKTKPLLSGSRSFYEDLAAESARNRDIFQRLIIAVFVKAR